MVGRLGETDPRVSVSTLLCGLLGATVTTPRPSAVPKAYAGGRRQRPSRLAYALGALVIVAGLAVAYLGYLRLGQRPLDVQVTGYLLHDRSVIVRFDLTRSHPERPVACTLNALDDNGAVLGRSHQRYPPGSHTVTGERGVVPTPRRAVLGEVESCAYVAGR